MGSLQRHTVSFRRKHGERESFNICLFCLCSLRALDSFNKFELFLSPENKNKGRGGNKRKDSDSEDEESTSSSGGSAAVSTPSSSFNLGATRSKMSSSLERLKKALSGLHAGRASPSMLEHISVTVTHAHEEEDSSSSSSTSHAPLQALAAVTARDANTLVVTPFDPSPTTAAAITAALKLPPLKLENVRHERSGELVVPVPRATPEAVAALVKLARGEAEAARVAVRSARKEANKAISSNLDGGDDAKKRSEKSVQAAADEFVKKIDAALAAKESDLAAV